MGHAARRWETAHSRATPPGAEEAVPGLAPCPLLRAHMAALAPVRAHRPVMCEDGLSGYAGRGEHRCFSRSSRRRVLVV